MFSSMIPTEKETLMPYMATQFRNVKISTENCLSSYKMTLFYQSKYSLSRNVDYCIVYKIKCIILIRTPIKIRSAR